MEPREEEGRAGRLAGPLRARRPGPASDAGVRRREEPPPRRARFLDVFGCIWRYPRRFAHGVGRLLFLLRRRGSGAAGVVIKRGGEVDRIRNHAFMYDVRLAPYRHGPARPRDNPALPGDDPVLPGEALARDDLALPGDDPVLPGEALARDDLALPGDDPDPQGSNTTTAAGSDPKSTATAPASPLMVGDERVWGDELRLFADYCKESLTCPKQILCHRCIFEPHQNFGTKKFYPSDMLMHCHDKHTTSGFRCKTCMVRVGTPRELILHAHFCHELRTGWWNKKKYKEKMDVMKTD